MLQAAYSAAAGARAQQERVNVIAHNVANINSYGFKASTMNFKDTLYGVMPKPTQPKNVNLQQGTGVIIASTPTSFRQGTLVPTDVSMDFAIDGEGFFTVRNGIGELLYTRTGNFGLSVEADGNYLRNGDGHYVLDENMQRVQILDTDNFVINESGQVLLGDTPYAQLSIVTFDDKEGLTAVGQSSYMASITSGEARQVPQGEFQLRQGYLEASNVDFPKEMTKLIMAQRTLQMAARAITTVDEMEATTNNLRT